MKSQFLEAKFSIYLNRRVFVMNNYPYVFAILTQFNKFWNPLQDTMNN